MVLNVLDDKPGVGRPDRE